MSEIAAASNRTRPAQRVGVALVFIAIVLNIVWLGALGFGGWRLLNLVVGSL